LGGRIPTYSPMFRGEGSGLQRNAIVVTMRWIMASTDPREKLSSNKITQKMETPEQSCRELKRKLGAFLNNIECMLLWQE